MSKLKKVNFPVVTTVAENESSLLKIHSTLVPSKRPQFYSRQQNTQLKTSSASLTNGVVT